ncbi:MAG TPA: hypothetical protein VF300_00625 [Methanothrix sp.]
MRRFNHNFPALALAMIMLLAISVEASPDSNQSWTEMPWSNTAEAATQNATTLSSPLAFNLSGNEPQMLRFGSDHLNFSEYVPGPFLSELWVRTGVQWSRYEQIFQGDDVDIILRMPKDGYTDVYLVSYARGSTDHWNFKLLRGYYLLKLTPGDDGRLFMITSLDNQPSNALMLDVSPRADVSSSSPLDVGTIQIGKAKVTIKSEKIKGYDVYLDGVFYSSDISDGVLDGITVFTVGAGKTHTITVSQRDIQGNIVNESEHTKSFKRDMAYTLLIN